MLQAGRRWLNNDDTHTGEYDTDGVGGTVKLGRGPRGAHEDLKAAIGKVLRASWHVCRVHFRRNILVHSDRNGRRFVVAFIATAFAQNDAEADVLAYMSFPKGHRTRIHSTNPLGRRNGEIKRRTDVVGIFPNEDVVIRLVGAILLEQNDEWAVPGARYVSLETIAPLSDDALVKLSTIAA